MHEKSIELTKRLISCRSITPDDDGSLEIISGELQKAGFQCQEINRGKTKNLWALAGQGSPFLLFAGHVDVVPEGKEGWTFPPFEATENNGWLYGRGAQDMKTSVACFTSAACRFVEKHPYFKGTLGVLLTSDEEGDGKDGTKFVIEELRGKFSAPDFCIVGEPSCTEVLGDTIKNGRRGSLNGRLTIKGIQGHVAYPDKVKNPIHVAAPLLAELAQKVWDKGFPPFPPTSFQISNIHAGTGAVNVVPGTCEIVFNIRYNPMHSADSLKKEVETLCQKNALTYSIQWQESASPFYSEKTYFREELSKSIAEVTGMQACLSTSGGTSDGRFIKTWCPEVVEFGPVNDRIHKINERVPLKDVTALEKIYYRVMKNIFCI